MLRATIIVFGVAACILTPAMRVAIEHVEATEASKPRLPLERDRDGYHTSAFYIGMFGTSPFEKALANVDALLAGLFGAFLVAGLYAFAPKPQTQTFEELLVAEIVEGVHGVRSEEDLESVIVDELDP